MKTHSLKVMFVFGIVLFKQDGEKVGNAKALLFFSEILLIKVYLLDNIA